MLKNDTFFFATSDRVQLLLVSDKQKQDDHAVAANVWLTILRLSFSSSIRLVLLNLAPFLVIFGNKIFNKNYILKGGGG